MTAGAGAVAGAAASTAANGARWLFSGSLGLAELAEQAPGRGAEALQLLATGTGALAGAVELRNKGEVFLLVQGVGLLIGLRPGEFPLPLLELLARSYRLGPFPALWAVEGLGHDYAQSYWDQGLVPRGLLSSPRTAALPDPSLCMLNAGIGLSFAEHLIDGLAPLAPAAEVRRAVAEIVALCRDNARPGYLGAAYESLGLLTRLFHRGRVAAVDQALLAVAPEVRSYFWHGAGRALYFAPESFLPFSLWPAYAEACRMAPDDLARRNAVAGLTWALVLVNQRQPAVVSALLVEPHGAALERLDLADAFVNGVASSVVMRCATTPEAPFIPEFCRYRPSSPAAARLWERLVGRPCDAARRVLYPELAAANRLGEVFHYREWQ
jgi:hypothetical protein